MSAKSKNAISPTRAEDYPEWYQQVIRAADLSENSPVRGCMVIKPWGYAIWENMQKHLDQMFKDTGHVNAYFPLFIPLSFLEKEAEHVDGFAKECAVVTHHRLEAGPQGGLVPAGPLEEPLVVRPTSEMIIGASYAKWVQSYRDLPILINQWANVVRWEMRTRQFLRTAEFLWQEGHTVHATEAEAWQETRQMLDVYSTFAQDFMAMPVIRGTKAPHERFPGAVETMTIEAMMQDHKALQAGTSHYLGQNFAKAMNIKFQNEQGVEQLAYTTSWGVSTRLVGGLIMTHSDDDGLVLPPRLAPKQVVIMPVIRKSSDEADVMAYCQRLKDELSNQKAFGEPISVVIDASDNRGKSWHHIKRGVPIRIEIGPRDIAADKVCWARRDDSSHKKTFTPRAELVNTIGETLTAIQNNLFARALAYREAHTTQINNQDDFRAYFAPQNSDKPKIHGGFAYAHWCEDSDIEAQLKDMKVTHRCFPVAADDEEGTCIFTGKKSRRRSLFAKSY